MNLEDVVDPEYGLQQDEWSLGKPIIGDNNQLEVIGWSGKCSSQKFYILKCDICSLDPELFGEGYFKSTKYNLINRETCPCGCSGSYLWSKEQYFIRCYRKAHKKTYNFLGFVGEWRRAYTKIRMICEKHGKWETGTITGLLNIESGCPACGSEFNIKSDFEMIQSFFDSGAFPQGTHFWRSERKNRQGNSCYWYVSCPECGGQGESHSGNLQKGRRACSCSQQRQQECYINLIKDGEKVIAIKFGIARNSAIRAVKQNRLSVYEVYQHVRYSFPSIVSCKQAEKECKSELECGILTREEMKDGYTETTWAYNLEKIIEIYEENGGQRLDYLE